MAQDANNKARKQARLCLGKPSMPATKNFTALPPTGHVGLTPQDKTQGKKNVSQQQQQWSTCRR
eukprot:scaffold294754_cov15-Tisochrysis_lutea.AAC.1